MSYNTKTMRQYQPLFMNTTYESRWFHKSIDAYNDCICINKFNRLDLIHLNVSVASIRPSLLLRASLLVFLIIWIKWRLLNISWAFRYKCVYLLIVAVSGCTTLLVWRWTSIPTIVSSPVAIWWVTTTFSGTFVKTSTSSYPTTVLIEPAWVLWPFDIQSKSAKIGVLESITRLFCTTFALILYKCITFLY